MTKFETFSNKLIYKHPFTETNFPKYMYIIQMTSHRLHTGKPRHKRSDLSARRYNKSHLYRTSRMRLSMKPTRSFYFSAGTMPAARIFHLRVRNDSRRVAATRRSFDTEERRGILGAWLIARARCCRSFFGFWLGKRAIKVHGREGRGGVLGSGVWCVLDISWLYNVMKFYFYIWHFICIEIFKSFRLIGCL